MFERLKNKTNNGHQVLNLIPLHTQRRICDKGTSEAHLEEEIFHIFIDENFYKNPPKAPIVDVSFGVYPRLSLEPFEIEEEIAMLTEAINRFSKENNLIPKKDSNGRIHFENLVQTLSKAAHNSTNEVKKLGFTLVKASLYTL